MWALDLRSVGGKRHSYASGWPWWYAIPWLALICGFALVHSAFAAPGAALTCPSGGGVLHVGPGQTYATLGEAVSAASDGDTICVAAGLYQNDFVTTDKDLTIRGVDGLAHFEATGEIPNRKAIFVTSGNLTLEALEFSGARVSASDGGNGAGIRYEGGNLTIRQSYFHDNQEGILGAAGRGNVVVEDSKFVDNGQSFPPPDQTDLGRVHGIYLSNLASLTVDNSYFDSTHVGHHIKVVAPSEHATVRNSTLEDGIGPSGTHPSYSVDLPGGGNDLIQNNTIVQRPNPENNSIIHYSYDQAPGGVPPANSALTIDQNVVRDEAANGTLLLNQTTESPAVTNNVFVDLEHVASGPATLSGNTTAATSHSFVGPLLGLNGADGAGRIAEFARSGGSSGDLAQPSGIVGNSGIATLNGNVYVANRIQGVGIVDPVTGSSTLYCGPQGIEAQGTFQGMLIAGVFDNDTIVEFGVDGTIPHPTQLATITLGLPAGAPSRLGITGLDSNDDPTHPVFYVGAYGDGNVYQFDDTGAYLGMISTGLGGGVLSGLGFDRGDQSLWLATGYGNDMVYHYDLAGTLLDSFAAPVADMGGLDVAVANSPSPPSAMPEPPAGPILVFGMLVLAAIRRRRAAKGWWSLSHFESS